MYHYLIRDEGIVKQPNIKNKIDFLASHRTRYEDLSSRYPEYTAQLLKIYSGRVMRAFRYYIDTMPIDMLVEARADIKNEIAPFVNEHRTDVENYLEIPIEELDWLIEDVVVYRHKKSLKLIEQNKKLRADINKLKNSKSYKIGKKITYIPRKIKKLIFR